MGKIDKACELAIEIANSPAHGYDQANRNGPDYDCSSLVNTVMQNAGIPVMNYGATYTGNMYNAYLKCGFKDVTNSVNLFNGAGIQKGDVLLNKVSHTALYIGNGQLVQASGNERGGITGGQPGDQTGKEINISSYYNFPWDCILRYCESSNGPETVPDTYTTYTVQSGDSLWAIAEKVFGDGSRYAELAEYNGIDVNGYIFPGQVLKIPGSKSEETVQVPLSKGVYTILEARSKSENLTIDAYLKRLLNI